MTKSLHVMPRLLAIVLLLALAPHCHATADELAEARSLLDAGKFEQAESILRPYLLQNPESADAHFLLGYALFRDEKPKESLAEFTAGARFRHPRSDELKIVAADYVMLGDYSDADKWFTQVITETPDDADAWYLLGRTKYNENEFAAAITSLERALALHPRYVEAENNIGLSWRELNNHDKAQAAFQTAIEWQGQTPSDAQPFLNLGTLLAETSQNDKAVVYLTRAVALSPKNPAVHEELGKVYLAMNKLPDAQAELEKAIALSPDTSALHYKLGQILRKEGMQDRAQQEFDLVEKLNGTHSSSKTPNPPPADKPQPR